MNEALPIWKCEFADIPDSGAKLDSLTVGSRFAMKCTGDIAVSWDQDTPQIVFANEQDSYSLVVVKQLQLTPQGAQFEVTSYKPGQHTPDYFRVVQGGGAKGFEVSKPSWTTQSVLKPNEQTKPFGPFGPFGVSMPYWIWIALVVTVLLLATISFRYIRRHLQRKRMLEDLKRHRTALSPLHQFYRDARTLRRRLHVAKDEKELTAITNDLDREFRLFVLRSFEVPALDWGDGEIVTDIRKRYRKLPSVSVDALRKTLRELTRLKTQPSVQAKDVEQLHRMSLDAVERLDSALAHEQAKRRRFS